MSKDDRFVPGRVAARVCGVHIGTLRKWADSGAVRSYRLPKGHRRYNLLSIKQVAGLTNDASGMPERRKYVYARVSSSGQRADLERQVAALREQFPEHVVVRDVASGLNFKRPGFLRLLDAVCRGGVQEVVVAHFLGFAQKTPNL